MDPSSIQITVDGAIAFRPGHLLRAIQSNRWLVIDELNRADMDRIFGPAFTWLAGDPRSAPIVTLGKRAPGPGEPDVELAWTSDPACAVDGEELLDGAEDLDVGAVTFRAGTSWRLLGTYNAVDAQRVFRVGQALGRRFVRVPIPPISSAEFLVALSRYRPTLAAPRRSQLQGLYLAHLAEPETALGPALFLRMADYVERAPEDDQGLAEAYVVNVGAWLPRLEQADLAKLRLRIVDAGVLSAEE